MSINWKTSLNRGLNEFFNTQLSGITKATDPTTIVRFDDDNETITAKFLAFGELWKITLQSSYAYQKGTNGRIALDGPKAFEGPIDITTWAEIGRIIKAMEHVNG